MPCCYGDVLFPEIDVTDSARLSPVGVRVTYLYPLPASFGLARLCLLCLARRIGGQCTVSSEYVYSCIWV